MFKSLSETGFFVFITTSCCNDLEEICKGGGLTLARGVCTSEGLLFTPQTTDLAEEQ